MNLYSPFRVMTCFRRASGIMRLRRAIDAQVRARFANAPADRSSNRSLMNLRDGMIWSFEPGSIVISFAVIEGNAWVTQAGSSRDVVLGAGESFQSAEVGKVVAQALGDSVIEVVLNRANVVVS
jgi:hypothetical protein